MMTTLYENQMYERMQREAAGRQRNAPTETVGGVTFQKTVHGDSRPEEWHVFDMGISLTVVDASHDHQGARFTGWMIGAERANLYPTRRAAMAAAAPRVRTMITAQINDLTSQLRTAQAHLAVLDRAQGAGR